MKILVLSSDVAERTGMQQVLRNNGHEMVPAADSETALQLLQEGEIRFVIADRASSDVDAREFVRQVRQAEPPYYIYILLLTDRVPEGDSTRPRLRADDILRKPFSPADLLSRLRIGERILSLGDELSQARQALENTALFDPLTKVLNHPAFLALSRGELERARRAQSPLSLIALDIDNFKAINERFGKTIGNDVLLVVAGAIREKSRPYDTLGRYTADTFLIILPGVIGPDAEKIAERILMGIRNTEISLLDGTMVTVKLSAGVTSSVHITAATEVEYLQERALGALRQAKRDGGNRAVTVFA